jgi:hypothetical protein
LLFGCVASVSGGMGRLEAVRLEAGRLVLRRFDGRADFIVAVRGRDTRGFGLAVEDFGLAGVDLAAVLLRLPAVPGRAGPPRTVGRFAAVRGLAEEGFGFAADAAGLAALGRRVLPGRRAVVLADRLVLLDRLADGLREPGAGLPIVAAMGFADCMTLAAAVRALAAVAMALVAVFIDRMADDIVLADVVALVAAAVILEAADVTLVAADDTFLAAAIGVAELREEDRRAVLRVERVAPARVERAAELRVDRDAGLRVVDEAVPRVDAERVLARLAPLVVLDFGRAVPDALRLADLVRAVLAELRRLAARVVVLTGTECSSPVLINYGVAIPPAARIYTHSEFFRCRIYPKYVKNRRRDNSGE